MSYVSQTRIAPRAYKTGFWAKILNAQALYSQRHKLDGLTAAQLQDIGLNRTDVERELSRPLWNAPVHWHR